jgi:hypothetical protein
MKITGLVLTGLVTALLVSSAVGKFMGGPQDEETKAAMAKAGMTAEIMRTLAIIELTVAALYAIPQTMVLGATLVVGYLGGAVWTHLHAGDPAPKILTPILIGIVAWAGVWARDARVRALTPLRSRN